MTLDLLTVGRVSVDLYADAPGAGFVDEQRFVKSIGGTATNVAAACARLGHRTAVFTRLGDDLFGEYVRGDRPVDSQSAQEQSRRTSRRLSSASRVRARGYTSVASLIVGPANVAAKREFGMKKHSRSI
jgi:hypothetical protein